VDQNFFYAPGLIYRGQCDANWALESKLDRLESRFPTRPNYSTNHPKFFDCPPVNRKTHLEAFKECVRGRRGQNPRDLTENEWWALAQHHGLATPLLDWAISPFVALFFAFEHEGYIDCKDNTFRKPTNRAIYAASYLVAENGTIESPSPFIFSPRREVTFRLSSQTGVLMKMPPRTDLESIVQAHFPNDSTDRRGGASARAILTKITIPSAGRLECLRLLDKMNINRLSLFGDLDAASQYINSLWELDFPTGLGVFPDGSVEV